MTYNYIIQTKKFLIEKGVASNKTFKNENGKVICTLPYCKQCENVSDSSGASAYPNYITLIHHLWRQHQNAFNSDDVTKFSKLLYKIHEFNLSKNILE